MMNSKPRRTHARTRKPDTGERPAAAAPTPLARMLLGEAKRRASPADAFALARSKWLRGERLDIGQIAGELGVGRATLFRWVGSREQLYGAVLSEAYAELRRYSERRATGSGVDRVIDAIRRNLAALLRAAPLRKFIEQDPEFAIRVLTSKSSAVQAKAIALQAELLNDLLSKGEIDPALDVDTLSYIVVRIGESFLYADVISGRAPDIDKAVAAIRILLSARPERSPPEKPDP
jgi:AcrR family transcriptional regulator